MAVLDVLRSLIERLPEPILLFDADFHILGVNDAYARTFDEQPDNMVGQKCYQILHQIDHPCGTDQHPCPLQIAQQTGARVEEVRNQCSRQGARRVRVELIPITPDESGQQYFINRVHRLDAVSDLIKTELVGESAAFQSMMNLVERVARSSTTVLLLGESGTGKELVAHEIHNLSVRHNKNFVAIDCSGLPETLFESELFGHERGAFTGATSARAGLLETAHGGTLFIDEVGDIPLGLQVKLLRFLETGTYRRLGSTTIRHADVRIISATHQPLLDRVKQQLFRQDLYYRLSAFPIQLPNLKARIDDIPILVTTLLQRISLREQHAFSIDQDAIQYLKTLELKGNIRELRNLLERAVVLASSALIRVHDIQQALALENTHTEFHTLLEPLASHDAAKPLKALEDDLLLNLLNNHRGNKRQLAEALGISERTLYRRLNKLA
ncbi:MAG: sigma 54-interacting transcriptional regulator [Gammaproteobacteria bacterium]|nr:sigma 54-interacting transcriptional regulator [Gammaproteobacteria bacterium]